LDEVDQLRVQWLREGKSPSTVNSNLRAISAFENWRVERLNNERIAAGQPLLSARKFKRALEVQKTIKSWDDNALDQMLAYIDDKIHLPPQCVNKSQEQRWELLRRAFFLLKYTGMRGSEVNNLRWSDIKFINGKVFIHLEDHETAAGDQFHVKAKHEEFSLVIFDELIHELQSWEQDHEFILRGYWKSAVELGRAFKTVQEHLALKSDEKPLHAFRAFFCGELFKMGASTEYVRRQMRHRSAVTTARYLDSRNDGMGDHLIELARQFKASKRA
jgi:integrase